MDARRGTVATGDCLAASLAGLVALLVVLVTTVGLTRWSVVVGLVCGAVLAVSVARGAGGLLGPADLVTLLRATLACAVAALVTDSYLREPPVVTLVSLTAVALALDAVDGRVARVTGTMSAFGGRFDGEADAFLILVLSVYLAPLAGLWVLGIGLARYAFAVAGWWLPWMRAQLPFRYWRKVVTAVQGIVLTVAAADVVPDGAALTALLLALGLLAESFGRDVWWLWQHRPADVPAPAAIGQVAQP